MDLEALKIFYVVAREKQITSASACLGKTQPAISERLKRFQKDLDTQLYTVGKNGIILTATGELLFEKAKKILSEVETLKYDIQNASKAKCHLRIATTHAFVSQVLMKVIPRFIEECPEVNITIIADDSPLDLNLRETDISVRTFLDSSKHLQQDFLATYHIQLFASRDYLNRNGTPQKVQDLENHILISYPEDVAKPYSDVNWHLSLISKNNRIAIRVNSSHALQMAAISGAGIISLSKEAIILNDLDVERVLPELEGPSVDMYYVYNKSTNNNKYIQSFFSVVKAFLKEKNINK